MTLLKLWKACSRFFLLPQSEKLQLNSCEILEKMSSVLRAIAEVDALLRVQISTLACGLEYLIDIDTHTYRFDLWYLNAVRKVV